jgi:uncharacterized protein GlcG (DUF336 family)
MSATLLNQVIGAVGVSSGSDDEDLAVAQAACDAVIAAIDA